MASIRDYAKRVQDLRELLEARSGQRNPERSVLDRLGGSSAPSNNVQSSSYRLVNDDDYNDSFDGNFLKTPSDADDESRVPVFPGLEARNDSSKAQQGQQGQQGQQDSEELLQQTQEAPRGSAPMGVTTTTTEQACAESHSNSCHTEEELFRAPVSCSDDTLGAPAQKRRRLENASSHIISQSTDAGPSAKNTGSQPVVTSVGNIAPTMSVVTPPEESTKVVSPTDNIQEWILDSLIGGWNTGSSDSHLMDRNNSTFVRPADSGRSLIDKDRLSGLIIIEKQPEASPSFQDTGGKAGTAKSKSPSPPSNSLPPTSIGVSQSTLPAGTMVMPTDRVCLTGTGTSDNANVAPRSAVGPNTSKVASHLTAHGNVASLSTPQSANAPSPKGTTTTHTGLLSSGSATAAGAVLNSQHASTTHGTKSGPVVQESVPVTTSTIVESGSWKLPFPAPTYISEPSLEWFKHWIAGKDQVAVKNALLMSSLAQESHHIFIKVIRSFTLNTLKYVLHCLFPFRGFRLSLENDLEGIEMAIKAFGAYKFGSEPKVNVYHVNKLMVAQVDHLLWALGFEPRLQRQYKREKVNTLMLLFSNRYSVDSHQISVYDLIVAGHLTSKPAPARKGSEKTLDEILGNYGRPCNPASVLRFVPENGSGPAIPTSTIASFATPQSLHASSARDNASLLTQENSRRLAGSTASSPLGTTAAISRHVGPIQSNMGGKVVGSGTGTSVYVSGKPRSHVAGTAGPGVSLLPEMHPSVKQPHKQAPPHKQIPPHNYKSKGSRRPALGKHSANIASTVVCQVKQFVSMPSFNLGKIMNSDIFTFKPLSVVTPVVFTISELGSYGSDKFSISFQTPVPAIGLSVRCISLNGADHSLTNFADETKYCESYPLGVAISLNGNMNGFDRPYAINTAKLISPNTAGVTRSNNLKFFPIHSSRKDHRNDIYCVFLCESSRRSLDEMTRALRAKSSNAVIQSLRPKVSNFRPSMTAIEVEKEFALSPMKNSELGISLATISLKCSLSYVRINVPARGKACQHFQCFDLAGFVDLFIQSGANKCPVCSQRIDMNSLIISPFFEELLRKHHDLDEIELLPSGETKARVPKNMSVAAVNIFGANVVDLTVDDDVPRLVSKSKPPQKPLEVIVIDD